MGAQRAAKRSHRGGLIPDLVILRFYLPSSDGLPVTRTYDVKTIRYSEKYYRASIPAAARPTLALRRSRPITRPGLGR